jgi:hypothetical protein
VPAPAASVAPRHAGWMAFAQDALKRGAQAARIAMGQAPKTDPSVGAAIVPGQAAGMAAALSPPDTLLAPAPASAEVVAVLLVEPPVAADAWTAEVPLLEVISDLPSLGHKEGAAAVAEVGDRKPTSLAEVVPDASTAGGPDALEEGCLDDEREEQSRDELREYAEAAMGSLRPTMEILSKDIPRVLKVKILGIPFA